MFEIPFNSANKWSLAVTSCPGDKSHQLILMKGAPEIILTKCSHHLHNKQEREIDEVSRRENRVVFVCTGVLVPYLSPSVWGLRRGMCAVNSLHVVRGS